MFEVALELLTFVVVVFVIPAAMLLLWCFLVDPLDRW